MEQTCKVLVTSCAPHVTYRIGCHKLRWRANWTVNVRSWYHRFEHPISYVCQSEDLNGLLDLDVSVIYYGNLNVSYQEINIHNSKANAKRGGHTPEERKAFGEVLKHGPQLIDCYWKLWPDYRRLSYLSCYFGIRLKLVGERVAPGLFLDW